MTFYYNSLLQIRTINGFAKQVYARSLSRQILVDSIVVPTRLRQSIESQWISKACGLWCYSFDAFIVWMLCFTMRVWVCESQCAVSLHWCSIQNSPPSQHSFMLSSWSRMRHHDRTCAYWRGGTILLCIYFKVAC